VETGDGTRILKIYPPLDADPRPRLAHEVFALDLIARHPTPGLRAPQLIRADAGANAALLAFVEGEPALPPGPDDLERLVAAAEGLIRLSRTRDARDAPNAIGASLSGAMLLADMAGREDRLSKVEDEALGALMRDQVSPLIARAVRRAKGLYARTGLAWDADIGADARVLSPSDFGLHNALRTASGTLVFVDFEYFGWDDPVRLVADLMLHPAMGFDAPMRQSVRAALGGLFERDPDYAVRFEALFPLVALRWALIVLNEFLPGMQARRVAAGRSGDWPSVRTIQLNKAANLANLAAEYLSEA
jgi:hypothetical protein